MKSGFFMADVHFLPSCAISVSVLSWGKITFQYQYMTKLPEVSMPNLIDPVDLERLLQRANNRRAAALLVFEEALAAGDRTAAKMARLELEAVAAEISMLQQQPPAPTTR